MSLNFDGSGGGNSDVFLSKFDASGNLLWNWQLTTPDAWETVSRLTGDGLGNLCLSGVAGGDLGWPDGGTGGAFLIKLRPPVPEPCTLGLVTVLVAVALLLRRCGTRTAYW